MCVSTVYILVVVKGNVFEILTIKLTYMSNFVQIVIFFEKLEILNAIQSINVSFINNLRLPRLEI